MDIIAVSKGTIQNFLRSVSNEAPNRKSVYIRICRLRKFFRFLKDKGYLFLPLGIAQPVRARPSAPRIPPGVEEMEQALSQLRTDTPLCLKGKAILELAFFSALRPRELNNLKISDIDFKKGLLYLKQSKNRKDRGVYQRI